MIVDLPGKKEYYEWINKKAISPIPGLWEWEAPDGMLCIVAPYTCVAEDIPEFGLINITLENKVLKEQGIKDPQSGEILQVKTVREYFEKVRAMELGGVDSPKFQQEYCCVWDANVRELAAFYNFRTEVHTKYYKSKQSGWRTHVFIDFGLNHPCAGIAQEERYGTDYKRSHYYFHESYRKTQCSFDDFLDGIIEHVNKEYAGSEVVWYGTQEGVNPGTTGFTAKDGSPTPFIAMYKRGLKPILPNYKTINFRLELANTMLNTYDAGKPIFNFNPSNRDWIEMMEGGYRYGKIKSFQVERRTDNPIKDNYHDHLADGFSNWIVAVFSSSRDTESIGENYKGSIVYPI